MKKNTMKKIFLLMTVLVLTFSLSGCDRSGKWIFSVNGVELNKKKVDCLGIIYAYEHAISADDNLLEEYDRSVTFADYYKNDFEQKLLETALLYGEAKKENVKLSGEDKKKSKESADRLFEVYGEDFFKNRKIEKSDMEDAYNMRARCDAYVLSLSGDDKNEKDDRYIKVYQVTFSTVELSENNTIQYDADGKMKKVSSKEAEEIKEKAQEFADDVTGDDIEKKAGKTKGAIGLSTYLKYDDLSDEYKKQVDKISEGKCSGAFETEYGYTVFKLEEENADVHGELVGEYAKKAQIVDKKEEILDKLFADYVGEGKEYKNDELWEEVYIGAYAQP